MRQAVLTSLLLLVQACAPASGQGGNAAVVANAAAQANAATLAPAPAAEPAPIGGDRAAAGRYRLVGQMEAASGLELTADGRFRYFLAYGSLDQQAQGRWSSDGRRVALNTEPRPVPAEFSARPPSRSDEAALIVFVATPNGRGLNSVDVRIGLADGRVHEGYTQDYGWRLGPDERPSAVQWIELSLQAYGVPPRRFAVDGSAGNQFNFTFTPNDFGTVDFRDRIFQIEGRNLVFREQGAALVYERE